MIGKVVELWRYPVSSLAGELVSTAKIEQAGVEGDRKFALIDAATGFAAAPEMDKRWRRALYLKATFVGDGVAAITFPDDQTFVSHDRSLNEALSDYFGFAVALALFEADDRYQGCPITRHRHPHSAIHLITTTSVSHLSNSIATGSLSSRRFRPTALVETDADYKFLEDEWIGKTLSFGTAALFVEERTKRCGMTLISQPGLEENPEILRSLLRRNQRHFGISCAVELSGAVTVGDDVKIPSG